MDRPPFTTLRCAREGPTLRVTLDRPAVKNAIDGHMLRELREALALAAADPEIRIVRIDSACPGAFSAGIDVAWVKDMTGPEAREVGKELHRTFLALRTVERPVVAEVDGLCLGAGLELALSCDMIIASSRSRFGLPNIHRGIPAIVEAAILPLAVGIQGARELAFTGEPWSAARAEQRGLVTAVVEPEGLAAEVDRRCRALAEKSAAGLAVQKEIIHAWMTTDLEAAIDFSIAAVVTSFSTRDQKEAMTAFLEKRPARLEREAPRG